MMICLEIMKEFGFIFSDFDGENCNIALAKQMEKRDFSSSETLKKLKSRED